MTSTLSQLAISMSASPLLFIVLKTAVAAAAGLFAARVMRRGRASVRHLVLAWTFAAVIALPIAAAVMPTLALGVPVAAAPGPQPQISPSPPAPVSDISRVSRSERPMTISATIPAATLVTAGWATGALFFLVMLGAGLAKLGRLRRTGLPWLEGSPILEQIARNAGVGRRVELLLHEEASAPITFGAISPVIVLPTDAPSWDRPALQRALLHELEHIRRHDWPVHVTARAICAAYWFNPLVWIAYRQLSLEAERACDDAVVASHEGTAYAQQLVALARRLAGRPAQPALAMAARSDLSQRVAALLDRRQARGRAGAVRIALAAAFTVGCVAAMAPMRVVGAAIVDAEASGDQRRSIANRVSRGDRALVEAAEEGDLDEVKSLLDAGAQVNATVDGDGSPLIVAAREGHIGIVTFLLDRGADSNLGVEGDGNPLIMAAREGHLQVVDLLLSRGATIDQVVSGDENALIQASGAGQLAVVKLLVERGADVNARVWAERAFERPQGEWRTPLSQARRGRHREVEALLLAARAQE
jgi:beta-lactamase regulating signal transducer with metallopeptidase domain